jgi:hypothetical protein
MMALTDLAIEIAAAKEASTEFEAKATELLTALGTITEARHFDIGTGGRQLVAAPGWTPLRPPGDYILLSVPG